MEILGNTLREIAGEKAGIFKLGVPAFTTTQPEEAMSALENRAAQLGISLQVAPPLDMSSLNGLKLGLDGDHQYINAGLAIALCRALLQRTGQMEGTHLNQARSLPEEFVKGLATTNLRGRAQIVPDPSFHMQNDNLTDIGGLTFFLDGAHSPESMEVCAKWFSHAVKVDSEKQSSLVKQLYNSSTKQDLVQKDVNYLNNGELLAKKTLQILLFNCMSVRDPQRLLPPLINACACHGIRFQKALLVPNQSVFNKVGSHALPMNDSTEVDLSWQLTLQKVWENLVHDDRGGKDAEPSDKVSGYSSSLVFPSLPLALKWLRGSAQENTSVHFQVLVTGSLHLVGDILRLLEK